MCGIPLGSQTLCSYMQVHIKVRIINKKLKDCKIIVVVFIDCFLKNELKIVNRTMTNDNIKTIQAKI